MSKLFDSPAMRETVKRYLKSEMALKGLDYRALAARLEGLGIHQTEANLRMKISRGTLGAQLFVYILLALELRNLDLSRVQECLADVEATSEESVVLEFA